MTYEAWRISYQSSEQAARAAYAECALLRARIEAMEQQNPVGWFARIDGDGPLMECKHADISRVPLYPAPGAKLAPTALAGARKVTRDFRWDAATQCHVPTLKVEFEPVHIDEPSDAKGWQDQDRIAAMLEAAPEAKS